MFRGLGFRVYGACLAEVSNFANAKRHGMEL